MKSLLNVGALSTVFLLTACGGSGGSGDAGVGGGSGGGSNNLPAIVISADQVDAFAAIAVNSPEGMLQIGHYADTLAIAQSVSFGSLQLCSNGGARTVTVSAALPLQQGSVIKDVLQDCYIEALDSVLAGEVTLTVSTLQKTADTTTMVLDVNLTKALFKDYPGITVLDPVNVTFTNGPLLKQIQVEPRNAQVRFDFSDGDRFTLSNFTLSSRIDLATALYRNEFQGKIAFKEFSNTLMFKTAQPLQGYIGEYPHQGRIELSDSKNNILTLTTNQVINSELANVRFNTAETALYYWSGISDGAFWRWPGMNKQNGIRQFRHDNFNFVTAIGKTNLTDFPTQGTLSYLFSRPVKEISEHSLSDFFRNIDWWSESISAEVTIQGAVVHVKPTKALTPGQSYRLSPLEAVNELGQRVYVYSDQQDITVNDAVVAVLSKDRVSFSASSEPVLTADKSVLKNPAGVVYQWQELTDFGVVFSAPNSVTTSFTVPDAKAGQIVKVRLLVSDAMGNSHSNDASFFYHDNNVNVFYYESDRGDYIGAGATRFLSGNASTLRATSNIKSRINGSYEGQEEQHSIWWYMSFATADDKELVPGVYENATREPFKPEAGNGLSISGNGRGCNTLKGSFEIFEIEFTEVANADEGYDKYTISKLALDYVQHCEGNEPAMRGKIRINSNYRL